MPIQQELPTLYQKGIGKRNMDSAFKTTGGAVWAEPRSSPSAWSFSFNRGYESWYSRITSKDLRSFAVRYRR